jgi:hypothetical protein
MAKKTNVSKKTRTRLGMTAEEFITAWQRSDSLVEMCVTAGLQSDESHKLSARAQFYRRKGVGLKKFTRGSTNPLDIDALNKLAVKELR